MKKRIAVIGTVGVPSNYGGFETLVENLLDYLHPDFEVTVFCQDSAYVNRIESYKNAKLKYINLKANGASSIFYDIVSILKSFSTSDIMLILGVSGSIILPLIKPFYKGKIITNIDGLEWRRDKWGFLTKKFLKLSERFAVYNSDIVISDNLHIQKYVMEEYKTKSEIIQYGADHAQNVSDFNLASNYGIQKERYFFTVCRIEPENNLDLMVEGYSQSGIKYPYLIIGNFESSRYGINFRDKYASIPGLILLDPIYDQKILNQFRSNCFFYLHGHSAGGTNPSLVEAMYIGLPIIAFGVPYNKATTFDSAIYFYSSEELVEIFQNIESLDRDRLKNLMSRLAKENYSWEIICAKYKNLMA